MDKPRRIYLDYAASAPPTERAIASFVTAMRNFGNPSSPHEEGRIAAAVLHNARARIASMAGVKPRHVVFTSGATESNALAIQGFLKKSRLEQPHARDPHILYLPTAHSSTVNTVEKLTNEGVRIDPILLIQGEIDLKALESLITPDTILIAVDAVCGETGTRFDLRGVRKVLDAAQARFGITHIQMHVDASQLPFVESFDRLRLAADSATLDAQKVGGVRGIGALIVGDLSRLAAIVQGGGQEEGLRPGTEPGALAAAFATALEEAAEERERFVLQATTARYALIHSVSTAPVPGISYDSRHQAPHILNVSYPGIDTDFLITILDSKGYAVSTKSACETDNEGSRAVMILTGDNARAGSTLRISWGPGTPNEDLTTFATALNTAAQTLYEQQRTFDIPLRA